MPTERAAFALALLLAASLSSTAGAEVIMTVAESGSDVVVTTSGSIGSLAGLTGSFSNTYAGVFEPGSAYLRVGSGTFEEYTGLNSYPMSFGSIQAVATTADVGGPVGVYAPGGGIFLPSGYTLGTELDITATFSGQSFATLGLTAGSTYTFSWTGDSIEVVIAAAVPEPASIGLMMGGLGLATVILARRRRES